MLWLFAVIWILCGIETYGRTFAYFQRKYPTMAEEKYSSDILFCGIICFTCGPIVTVVSLEKFSGYGYKFW